jgi:hypothetical protein
VGVHAVLSYLFPFKRHKETGFFTPCPRLSPPLLLIPFTSEPLYSCIFLIPHHYHLSYPTFNVDLIIEYLYLPAVKTQYASEFGHLIRILSIYAKVEHALDEMNGSCSTVLSHSLGFTDVIDSSRNTGQSSSHARGI